MNNFGVIEVASTRTTHAPGWAYVPDTGPNPAALALQPSNRKRAAATRNKHKLGLSDLSARQEVAVRKELEQLDRDGYKDAAISVPPRAGGSRAQNKHTPNVRKILTSQKTFANHLSDYEALQASADSASGPGTPRPQAPPPPVAATAAAATPTPPPVSATASGGGAASARDRRAAAAAAKKAQQQQQHQQQQQEAKNNQTDDGDVAMTDAPPPPEPPASMILPPYKGRHPAPHPQDADPLLRSRVPPLPSDDELRALLRAPPMSYPEVLARAAGVNDEANSRGSSSRRSGSRRYPARTFCAVCGYWGRVRCLKCGTRVCALECLEIHREECVTRYGL